MTESLNEFQTYSGKHETEILRIMKIAGERKANDDTHGIKEHASELLSYRVYVATCMARFNQLLDNATFENLPAKYKTTTEMDRKANVDKIVSIIRYWRDVTKSIVDTIDKQVSFAQTILSLEKELSKNIGMSHS